MKMELTNELKARFFALYWGQRIIKYGPNSVYDLCTQRKWEAWDFDGAYLELRPLSSITEEEKLDLFNFCFQDHIQLPDDEKIKNIEIVLFDSNLHDYKPNGYFDWLRERSFAVEYNRITVDQWIEWGVVKLKEA